MLKQLRLKNWRSVRDATIDFTTPITVLIGTNSSGKTNILDSLHFLRDTLRKGIVQVVFDNGYEKILTDAFHNREDVEISATYRIDDLSKELIRHEHRLRFDKRDVPFYYGSRLFEGENLLQDEPLSELPARDEIRAPETFWAKSSEGLRIERIRQLITGLNLRILHRWQLLRDTFVPEEKLSAGQGGDVYSLEPDARNMLRILDYMQRLYPDLYDALQDDLKWLLTHVSELDVRKHTLDREIELVLYEERGKRAPTISMGTQRLIAILTAVYALDMPQQIQISPPIVFGANDSGLVVIEEPDTALNPGVLSNFVEQLRIYAEGDRRQFILTTHNPRFLDYFKPEEVRVVSRDTDGYTKVEHIPEHIDEVWLDDHTLGEVWMTRSLGGLPE